MTNEEEEEEEGAQSARKQARVRAVPLWLAATVPGGEIRFAEGLMAMVSFASVAIIFLNIYSVVAGLGVASDGSVDDPSPGTNGTRLA